MALTVPTLGDDAIVLRPPEPGDAAAITAAVQDPDIPRFTMIPSPYSVDDAAAFIDRSAELWRTGAGAPFVIVDGATGTLLGGIGLHELDVDTTPAHVGYWVAAGARGRGIATRALRLVTRWALDDLRLPRLELSTFVDNDRSQRVAVRAGFTRDGARTVPGHPSGQHQLVVFSLEPATTDVTPRR
jgi:RimJ/RimL family protein N-acetyltransferase